MSIYTARFEAFRQQYQTLKKRVDQISWLRLVVFAAGIGLGWLLLSINYIAGGAVIIGVAVLFLYLVKKHAQLDREADLLDRMAKVNEAEIHLAEGKPGPYDNGEGFTNQQHPYSYDLDLFGSRSIFSFINRTASRPGRKKLASWLLEGLTVPEEILGRQEAVRELSPKLEFRQAAQAEGSKSQGDDEDLSVLLDWLNSDLEDKAAPAWLRWLLPAQFLLSIIVTSALSLSWYIVLASFLLNLFIVRQFLKRTQALHAAVDKRSKILARYSTLLGLIHKEAFEAPYMEKLKGELHTKGKQPASHYIHELSKIAAAFDQRLNIVAAFFFNGLWGWDLHLSARLDTWKENIKDEVPGWLDVLAELDALISLATFAYNHDNFCWPEPVPDAKLEGIDMGHILIPEQERVNNDLNLQQTGQYGLVTGANMAGKSTFLRTVGVNLVLAQAGAPVCATSFRWKPATIFTSMRATDSVQDRASYFYAELVRLRRIAELLKGGTEAYILLDEILRGTNSKDKAEGSRGFIEQLVNWPGMGLVATHDLSLAELEKVYPDKIRNLRFEIEIDEDKLHCSYKLQAGVSQNLNATFLMKQMGIVK